MDLFKVWYVSLNEKKRMYNNKLLVYLYDLENHNYVVLQSVKLISRFFDHACF